MCKHKWQSIMHISNDELNPNEKVYYCADCDAITAKKPKGKILNGYKFHNNLD